MMLGIGCTSRHRPASRLQAQPSQVKKVWVELEGEEEEEKKAGAVNLHNTRRSMGKVEQLWLFAAGGGATTTAECESRVWWFDLIAEVDNIEKFHHCMSEIPNREDTLLVSEAFARGVAREHSELADKVMTIAWIRLVIIYEVAYIFFHPELWKKDWLARYLTL